MLDNRFVLLSSASDVKFTTDVQNNALVFEVDNFEGTFYCDHFRYKELLLVAKGSIEVDLKKIKVTAGIGFDKTTSSDGRDIPFIKAVRVDMDISRRDVKIHIHGNVWSDFADIITPFIKGFVLDSVEKTAEDAMNTGIPLIGNSIMTKLDGYFPLTQNWIADWETPYPAVITDTMFAIGCKGLMFDKRRGEEEPTIAVPVMPYYDSSKPDKYQAYVSAYSIDGFFNSFIEVFGINGWVNSTSVPSEIPVKLNTDTVNILLPGMSKHYGTAPVDIRFNVTSLGGFEVSEANENMSGLMSIDMQFWVE